MRNICLTSLILLSIGGFAQQTIIDERDGSTYEILQIGSHLWFKENLKYKTPTSWCSEKPNSEACRYGNYYYPTDLINICPANWRVPTWREYRSAIQEIEKYYDLTDTIEYNKFKSFRYKDLHLDAEVIINITLIDDTTFFELVATGFIEGDKWTHQQEAAMWIVHDISNTPQPHVHVDKNYVLMHSHANHVLDKPKKLRRFAVRCVSDVK